MIREKGTLARYAVESSKIGSLGKHTKLFQPTREDAELSVACIVGLDDDGVKDEGIKVVKRHRNATHLHGWLEFTKATVKEIGLRVCCDNNPPRHARILGWPENLALRKHRQQDLAKRSYATKLDAPILVN